jgi:hypothetical protein
MKSSAFRTQEAHVIRLGTVVLLGTAMLWPTALLAQSPGESGRSARVGDRFIYDTKDEVTGEPKGSYVAVVTEVSDKEIVNSISVPGKPGSRIVVYDRDLNRLDDSTWKFKPSDGQGIRLPLAVGKTWRIEYEARNIQSGIISRTTGVSKVAGQESVTTPAGTFETFKIELHLKSYNPVDQTKVLETDVVTWYAPNINRWVRRTSALRAEKRLRSSMSEELADLYGRM